MRWEDPFRLCVYSEECKTIVRAVYPIRIELLTILFRTDIEIVLQCLDLMESVRFASVNNWLMDAHELNSLALSLSQFLWRSGVNEVSTTANTPSVTSFSNNPSPSSVASASASSPHSVKSASIVTSSSEMINSACKGA